MRKKIIIYVIIFIILAIGSIIYFGYFNNENSSLSKKQNFISPLRLTPHVSREETRKTICINPVTTILIEICKSNYNLVAKNDIEKINELFLVLERAKDDKKLSDYEKFLIAKLVFVTLPIDTSPTKTSMDFSSWLVSFSAILSNQANAQQPPSSQANFQSQLLEDLTLVRASCPEAGYENWTITAMCSRYVWIDGKEQPIYSKEYAEAGGPCAFSESAGDDVYHSYSIIDTIMRSEKDFINKKGESTQTACVFSCGSYNCPALTEEYVKQKDCKNPIYRNMGTVMPWDMKDPEYGDYYNRKLPDFIADAKSDCAERGYSYTTRADGTSSRKKVKDCKLREGSFTSDERRDPPLYTPTIYETACCLCDNPVREPYVNIKDFTQSGFKGDDVLKKLLDATQKAVKDSTPVIKKDTTPKPPPVIDTPTLIPTKPPVIPKKPEEKTTGPICCYDSKARNGINYYLPFSGNCETGDVEVPLDSKCANPLAE